MFHFVVVWKLYLVGICGGDVYLFMGLMEKLEVLAHETWTNLCIVLAHSAVVVFTTASVIFILIPVGVMIGVV